MRKARNNQHSKDTFKRGCSQMSKRTNTAQWEEKYQRWRIAVQKDGVRKQFYSSTPGRTGQREANRKADSWLEDGIGVKVGRVEDVYKLWLDGLKLTTSEGNWEPVESRWRVWVLPSIGKKRVNTLTDADLQAIINKAHAAGRSRKTLQLLAGDLRAFCKYCRKSKLSTFLPEDVQIPAGARLKGKKVLQPDDLLKLFSIDTTLYRSKRVHDDYIHAYRFEVLTGLRPGELLGLRWKVFCTANEMEPVSLYELRHTFVSVVKTLPAGEVKELVGHSEDMDTFGIYSHALTGEDVATAQAVNATFLRLLKPGK